MPPPSHLPGPPQPTVMTSEVSPRHRHPKPQPDPRQGEGEVVLVLHGEKEHEGEDERGEKELIELALCVGGRPPPEL